MKLNRQTIITTGISAAVLSVGLGGVAMASIPSQDGTITACIQPQNGNVAKVIDKDAGQTCASNETPLSWNQTGPRGPQGPQGPQGEQGAQGPAGSGGGQIYTWTANYTAVPDQQEAVIESTDTIPAGATITVLNREVLSGLDDQCDLYITGQMGGGWENGPGNFTYAGLGGQSILSATEAKKLETEAACYAPNGGSNVDVPSFSIRYTFRVVEADVANALTFN